MSAYRFVLKPRWVALHVLVWVVLIPSFIWLAGWQERGYHHHKAQNDAITAALGARPVPLAGRDGIGARVTNANRWTRVTVSGTYDTAKQLLVRSREDADGTLGYDVVTPLVLPDGDAVLVNRGWVGMGSTTSASPKVAAPPAGTVRVLARLYQDETSKSTGIRPEAGLPAGQIVMISSTALRGFVGHPLYDGYVALVSQRPSGTGQPSPVAPPATSDTPYMYMAYWIQWWVFGIVAVSAWIGLLRHEALLVREALEDGEALEDEGTGGPDDADDGTRSPGGGEVGEPAVSVGATAAAPAGAAKATEPAAERALVAATVGAPAADPAPRRPLPPGLGGPQPKRAKRGPARVITIDRSGSD